MSCFIAGTASFNSPFCFKSLFNGCVEEAEKEVDPPKPGEGRPSIYAGFRLPIEYLDKNAVFEVSEAVASDLELCPPQMDVDASGNARLTKSM